MLPSDKISKHFTWHEALWLPTWNRHAMATDGLSSDIESNLVKLFNVMDLVRDYFGKPITIHVAYRPPAYNQQIGGAPNSAHKDGLAADFHVEGMDCDEVRDALLPKLEGLGMRMEDKPHSTWVHLDCREPLPGHARFFKP